MTQQRSPKDAGPRTMPALLADLERQIAAADGLDERLRPRMLEQLQFLAEQYALPKPERRLGLIQAVIVALDAGLERSVSLRASWPAARERLLADL